MVAAAAIGDLRARRGDRCTAFGVVSGDGLVADRGIRVLFCTREAADAFVRDDSCTVEDPVRSFVVRNRRDAVLE
jgi:hypothetical protein